jgi:type IV secretion system protein VirB4
MSEVMDKGESTVIPVLKYLFHKIMSQLDGRPTTIIIEESWMAFNNPTFSKELAKWLDTMRKLNTNIVLVTTNITQVAKSSIKDTLLQQCMTTILTPNVKLDKDLQTREAYTEFGLNPRQLDILSKAQAKRQYYFMNPDGCKLFNLDMDSFVVSKAFFCRISIEDLIKAKELKKYYQENFAKKWLEYCGLPAYATQL